MKRTSYLTGLAAATAALALAACGNTETPRSATPAAGLSSGSDGVARPGAGEGFELPSITIAGLGGTQVFGGRGRVSATPLAAVLDNTFVRRSGARG